jgi:hypothetical protein
LRALRLALMDQQDFAAIERLCQPLLDSGRADEADYNDCAWNTLFLPAPRPPGIPRARRSLEVSGAKRDRAQLHTLGTLYAADDQATEAYGVMLDALKAGGPDEPQPVDWFVFGRMAETYGLPDAALKAYARVTKPEELSGSTWVLAQERAAALGSPTRRPGHKARP